MGYFRHQPGMTGPIQADHYVVALAIEDGCVLMHDPQGFPYATLPLADFMAAWAADTVDYGAPTPCARASRASRRSRKPRPSAPRCRPPRAGSPWIRDGPFPPARWQRRRRRSAGEQAARRLRRRAPDASDPFRGRVGARRASDAAGLARAGCPRAAAVAAEQARYIGALQHPLVTRRDASAAQCLRRLAPTYSRLLAALRAES